jgi:hypothetical protein
LAGYLDIGGISGYWRNIWILAEYLDIGGISGYWRNIWILAGYLDIGGISGYWPDIWILAGYLDIGRISGYWPDIWILAGYQDIGGNWNTLSYMSKQSIPMTAQTCLVSIPAMEELGLLAHTTPYTPSAICPVQVKTGFIHEEPTSSACQWPLKVSIFPLVSFRMPNCSQVKTLVRMMSTQMSFPEMVSDSLC